MIFKRTFDETSNRWDEHEIFNEMFLNAQRTYCEELFRAAGYISLTTILESLDLDLSREAFIYGWHRDRDSHVNFEITKNEDNGFLLTFECEEILDYFESEGA